jgi:hypothetical protein
VVVATHFWSFILILLGIVVPVVTVPFLLLFGQPTVAAAYATHDDVISAALQICFAVYLFFMLRRAYGIGNWYSALASAAIAWSMFHILWLYRFILFFITMKLV